MTFQRALTELGNRLVDDHKFQRSNLVGTTHENRTTEPIIKFLIWLNETPEAKLILKDLGFTLNPDFKTTLNQSLREMV
jgi:hypothetical protein